MGTPTQVCVWSCPNFSAPAGRPFSSRVPVPLLEDPYEAIGQAYLYGTDTESEPFEDPIDTKTPETARMAVRVPHAMSSGLSAGMAEVAAMSESAFRKRFWSSYESSPSVSPPDLPSRKRYRGTSELVEDSEEDDDEEDEEIEESMDSDSVSEDAEDEGPTAEDEDPAAEDEGLTAGVEGPGMDDEGYGLDDESRDFADEVHVLEVRRLGVSVIGTEYDENVESLGGLIRDHAVRLEELSPALFKRYDRDIGELFTRSGVVRDEIFSHRYQFRSLEYKQERVAMTFRAIWRPVLALEAWAGQMDAQRAALWHAINDVQGENRDLRLQLVEERRARLELAEVFDGMRRGQEPRGGIRPWMVAESIGKSYCDRFGNMIIHLTVRVFERFWNGLPRMGRAEMVDQARLTLSPNVEVSFFKLLRTTDDIEDMTFDVYALPCYGLVLFIQRISLTGFPAQSVGSSNTDVLDSPCLLVLITGTSQSRQHVITSLIHIESCKSPTKSLFDVGSSRISIFTIQLPDPPCSSGVKTSLTESSVQDTINLSSDKALVKQVSLSGIQFDKYENAGLVAQMAMDAFESQYYRKFGEFIYHALGAV
ncbi:hypothetical protein Tco_0689877 [Tanacetum coccineum]